MFESKSYFNASPAIHFVLTTLDVNIKRMHQLFSYMTCIYLCFVACISNFKSVYPGMLIRPPLKKGSICFPWEHCFPFRVNSFSEGREIVLFRENISIALNFFFFFFFFFLLFFVVVVVVVFIF